jgi:hypothetical protein
METVGEAFRQPPVDDRGGGPVDVVLDPVVTAGRLLGLELQPGSPRVAVARLADAARV